MGRIGPRRNGCKPLSANLANIANFRKKFERGDMTFEEYQQASCERELADAQTYLDLLARHALNYTDETGQTVVHPTGVILGTATMRKWNEVSERIGSSLRLKAE
jgi:hypothetical protein